MDRRTFLKGLVLLGVSPYMPSIPFKPKAMLDKGLSNVAFEWAQSQSNILADIEVAARLMQEQTGYRPNKMSMSEKMARELGIDPDKLPLDLEEEEQYLQNNL